MNTTLPSTVDRIGSALSPLRCAFISVHGDPSAELGRDGAGGQNLYVKSLGMALAERGCYVDMFTRRESPEQPEITEHAPRCRTIRLTAGPIEFVHRDDIFPYLPEFVEAWLEWQKHSSLDYDVLHTNYWLSGWVGLRLKSRLHIPQVHTYHSIGAVKYNSMQEALPAIADTRLGVEFFCLEQADRIVATSNQERDDLRQFVSKEGRIAVIPCGVDTEHFSQYTREEARALLGIPMDTRLVLYVGRFDKRKGIETLVRACRQLFDGAQTPEFQLYLVGGARNGGSDATELQRIRQLVATMGLAERTTFTGAIDHAKLPPYYAAADLCVIPSYYEPFGLVAIEAMAAKTATIASRVGGLKHTVVDGETGLLVPPRHVESLARAIASLLENPHRARAMGHAGLQRVLVNYSRGAVAARVHKLYLSLVMEASPRDFRTVSNSKIPAYGLSHLPGRLII